MTEQPTHKFEEATHASRQRQLRRSHRRLIAVSNDVRGAGLDVEQGGGPPIGTAWTLEVAGDHGWTADLEHAAPVPCSGEHIEVIQTDGSRLLLRVREVIHVLQPSATDRPAVREEAFSPNAIVVEEAAEVPPRLLRAGLPRVVAVPLAPEPRDD